MFVLLLHSDACDNVIFQVTPFFPQFSLFQHDASKVLARFDLNKTWREFVFAFFIPMTLFIISFISLCIIQRTVKVGDDAQMRCKYCTDENSDIDDIDELANKCVEQLNAIEEAVNEQDLATGDQPSTRNVSPRTSFYWNSAKKTN